MLPNIPELVIFLVLAVIAVAAALGMLASSNAIYSALFLVVNFGVVATSVSYTHLTLPTSDLV